MVSSLDQTINEANRRFKIGKQIIKPKAKNSTLKVVVKLSRENLNACIAELNDDLEIKNDEPTNNV